MQADDPARSGGERSGQIRSGTGLLRNHAAAFRLARREVAKDVKAPAGGRYSGAWIFQWSFAIEFLARVGHGRCSGWT